MTKTTNVRFSFEELRPYPEFDVLVHGFADISGIWESAEPDVGLARGGWSFGVDDIFIDNKDPGGEPWQVPADHPLYSVIEKQLVGPRYADSICECLEDDLVIKSDPDYDRD